MDSSKSPEDSSCYKLTKSKPMKEFSTEEVSSWVDEKFDENIGAKFAEQKINGEGLIMLATKGSQDQLIACGLKLVGDQLKFTKLVEQLQAQDSAVESSPPVVWKSSKPSGRAISSELHKRVYNAKKKAVRAAAIKKWPGNSLPNFKKSPRSLEELSALVDEIAEECSYPPVRFLKPQIRQHVLDILNERRRNIRKGHDYTQVDKRTIKKRKVGHDVPESSDSNTDSQGDESVTGGDTDILSSDDLDNSTTDGDSDKCETSVVKGLTLQGARIIVTVMFSAIKFTDVTKQQITSACKQFKLPCSTSNPSKDDMALALANVFINQHYVKLNLDNLENIARSNVTKIKVF